MHRFKGNVNINKLLLEQNIKTGKPLLTLSLQLSTRDHGMHFLTEEKAWPAKKQHHLDHHQARGWPISPMFADVQISL